MADRLVWLVQTIADVPEDDEWLGGEETRVLAGFRFPKRRSDWRLGRWTAKLLIRTVLNRPSTPLCSFEIRAAADGAPEAFCGGAAIDLAISISHSHGRALCVAGPRNITLGCDLEHVEPREEGLVEDYFSPEEQALVESTPSGSERTLVVNLIWSAKESLLKAVRAGLRRDTRSVVVTPELPGEAGSWTPWSGRCLESSRRFYGWWRTDEGFVFTAASDCPASLLDPP